MSKSHHSEIMHSSLEPNWRTPPDLFAALDDEVRGFVVDLAADPQSCLVGRATDPTSSNALVFLGPGSRYGTNALAVNWADMFADAGPGFINMPYSRTLANAYRTGRIMIDGREQEHPIDLGISRTYEIDAWAEKCYYEARRGMDVWALMPYTPQTDWWRRWVEGHSETNSWSGFAAHEVRRFPHRISFNRPDGSAAASAGVNHAVVIFKPPCGYRGFWSPITRYWSYKP